MKICRWCAFLSLFNHSGAQCYSLLKEKLYLFYITTVATAGYLKCCVQQRNFYCREQQLLLSGFKLNLSCVRSVTDSKIFLYDNVKMDYLLTPEM